MTLKQIRGLAVTFFLVAASLFLSQTSRGATSVEELSSFREKIETAYRLSRDGKMEDAAFESFDGFRKFEESQVHRLIAVRSSDLYREFEGNWLHLTKAFEQKNAAMAETYFLATRESFAKAQTILDGSNGSARTVAFNAFMILFREGLEALLILGAVLATLRKISRQDLQKYIWGGALVAVVATFVLYAVSRQLLFLQGLAREAIEGVTMLVAAGVLFYLSFWLISKVRGQKWQEFIRSKVTMALSSQRIWALAALSFLVVFREGFETVLMLQALEAGAKSLTPIAQGLAVASVVLVGVFFAVIILGMKLPIRVFFSVTSAFLLVLVVKFIGDGILELQEAFWISLRPIMTFSPPVWLRTFFGFHPSVEGFVAQGAVLLTIAVGLLITLAPKKDRHEPKAMANSNLLPNT